MKRWIAPLSAIGFAAISALWMLAAPGPGVSNDFGGKRVLVIGIDGLRPDALQKAMATGMAPNLKALVDGGTVTWNAFAGGKLATPTQQSTLSGPGWSSIFTGTWIDRHNVSSNGTPVYDQPGTASSYLVSQAPHFARRLHEKVPTARVDLITSWNWINTYLAAAQSAEFGFRYNAVGATYPLRDADVKNQTLTHLAANDPDVLQLHFDQVDGTGHASGFSPDNPAYLTAIATVDAHIGDVMAAIHARPQSATEKWSVLITTDHGGTGTSHGGQSGAERNIFVIANGPDFAAGKVTQAVIGHTTIPPTVLAILGVATEPTWQWSDRAFGLPPLVSVYGAGTQALVEITQPPTGSLPGCTGIEVRRNGALVSTLPAGATSYTDTPSLPATGTQTIAYELTFVGTAEVRTGSATLGTGGVALPDLTTDLVVHLPFEGNTTDNSGRGNNGSLMGSTANFTTGQGGGQAMLVNATQYVSLGQPSDLQFGGVTDFTIAFWVKTAGGWAADPSFISNKNWASGANPGWIIAGQQGGPNWQWNFKGDLLGRKDFDPTGVALNNNQWHHICVTHSRTGNATFYHNGAAIGTSALSGAGVTNTLLPVNIGRDGAGGSAFNVDVSMDDVKIWRRALTAADVAALNAPVVGPPDVTSDLVLSLPFDGSSQDVSGRENHGTLVGGTTYAAGKSGQAVALDGTQYVTLGQPTDLKFGAATPFTISMWVKNTAPWTGDPSLISNKNWASGGNQGWFIGGQNDGSAWQWNLKGASSARMDFDLGGSINDGQWHHLAVSHHRSGNATFYQDGVLLGSLSIQGSGDVDTALPINIGRDGSGVSGGINCLVDDVKIWRRALTSADLALITPAIPPAWAAWLKSTFNSTELQDPAISAATADPDADGLTNLEEFAFGSSPLVSNPSPVTVDTGGRGIQFPEMHGGLGVPGFGYTAQNVRSTVLYSPNLSQWEPLTTPMQSPLALQPRDGKTRLTTLKLSPALGSESRGFLKLKLELVPP